MIFNENNSWAMPSSRFTVNKKTTLKNHIYIFYVSKCLHSKCYH